MEIITSKGEGTMQKEKAKKRKYKKKNDFKINLIFNEKGETLETIIERAFGNYCLKKNQIQIMVLNEIVWYNQTKSINIISLSLNSIRRR